jgi:hypothetical protein
MEPMGKAQVGAYRLVGLNEGQSSWHSVQLFLLLNWENGGGE